MLPRMLPTGKTLSLISTLYFQLSIILITMDLYSKNAECNVLIFLTGIDAVVLCCWTVVQVVTRLLHCCVCEVKTNGVHYLTKIIIWTSFTGIIIMENDAHFKEFEDLVMKTQSSFHISASPALKEDRDNLYYRKCTVILLRHTTLLLKRWWKTLEHWKESSDQLPMEVMIH